MDKITERTEGFYPPEVMEGPFREPIARLGKMITDRIPQKLGMKKIQRTDPEYWALALMITDEEAEIALKFGGIRKPRTLGQMAQITGMPEAELEPKLERMAWAGVLEYNWENPQHEKQYLVPMFVPGSGEFSNMNPDLMRAHPELGMFFNYMTRLPLEKVTKMVPPGGAGIGMHVIPVEKAIRMEDQSVSIEHISHWLDKYDGKYAASPCSCRRSRKTYDEGCADDEEGWCIAVGDMADYVQPEELLRHRHRALQDRLSGPHRRGGYLKLASQGRYRDALALIKKNNPLPAICGHICNRRCEAACTRGTIDQAVAIDEVKKFIAMQDLNAETRYIPEKVVPRVQGEFDEKVAIIGAGPAGLSCAFYLAEKGYHPTVFEKNPLPGGMLTYGIPAFKLEKKVVRARLSLALIGRVGAL